jgi:hypothetical protein
MMAADDSGMLPAIIAENRPRLIRAIKLLAADPRPDAAVNLADELAGISAMVAEKFTNERTADGIQKALYLTVGGVSLGLEHLLTADSDQAALDFLVEHGAEHAFQAGFRLIRELSQLPEDGLIGDYEQDPVYVQRRLRDLFVELCGADPHAKPGNLCQPKTLRQFIGRLPALSTKTNLPDRSQKEVAI